MTLKKLDGMVDTGGGQLLLLLLLARLGLVRERTVEFGGGAVEIPLEPPALPGASCPTKP